MRYVVTLDGQIDFAPATETAEILQNVRTIISTIQGEVPLDRTLGLPGDAVDKPHAVARALFRAAAIEAIQRDEPRAKVRAVEFEETLDDALDGIGRPRVIITIGNEEEEVDLL